MQNKLQQQLKEEGAKESGVQGEKEGEKEGSPTHFAISMEVFAISYETHLGGKILRNTTKFRVCRSFHFQLCPWFAGPVQVGYVWPERPRRSGSVHGWVFEGRVIPCLPPGFELRGDGSGQPLVPQAFLSCGPILH